MSLPSRLPFHDPISTWEAARIADCTPEAIRQRCAAGRARACRIGRNWFVSMRWAEEYGAVRRERREERTTVTTAEVQRGARKLSKKKKKGKAA